MALRRPARLKLNGDLDEISHPPQAVAAYAALAARRGISPVQLALGYVRSRWYLGAAIVEATTIAQLAEDIDGVQFALDPDTLSEIAAIQAPYPNPAA